MLNNFGNALINQFEDGEGGDERPIYRINMIYVEDSGCFLLDEISGAFAGHLLLPRVFFTGNI